MREILFRGKSVDIYGWLYGHYVHQYDSDMIYLPNGVDRYCGFDYYFIKPETVGQFTGLTDKNGKKIFEGDIVNVVYTEKRNFQGINYDSEFELIETVIYAENNACFMLKVNNEGIFMYRPLHDFDTPVKIKNIEVIGNIHDNPELLKEQDK